MPRKPTETVVEHRVTLGNYEREQLNRFIDGLQVKNIGTGVGAITDPIEAVLSNTLGTAGGLFFVAWALKRFFDIDVPIPTDIEDLEEGWAAILNAVNLDKEGREKLENYVESLELQKKFDFIASTNPQLRGAAFLGGFGVRGLKGIVNFIFTPLDNPRYGPTAAEQAAYEATSPAPGTIPLPGDPNFVGPVGPEMPGDEEEGTAIWQQATNEQIGDMWIAGQITIAQAINYLMQKNGWSYQYSANWLNDYEMQKYGN